MKRVDILVLVSQRLDKMEGLVEFVLKKLLNSTTCSAGISRKQLNKQLPEQTKIMGKLHEYDEGS